MRFTIYTADCTGNERNAIYPNKAVIASSRELGTAAAFDHVCAAYKDNYRSRDNFLASDVAVMDCDNDHTENPKEWVTGEKLLAMLPNVAVAIVPSRNSGKPRKAGKPGPGSMRIFPSPKCRRKSLYGPEAGDPGRVSLLRRPGSGCSPVPVWHGSGAGSYLMAGREANHHGFSDRPGTFGTRPDGTSLLYREFYPGRQPEQHHVPLCRPGAEAVWGYGKSLRSLPAAG